MRCTQLIFPTFLGVLSALGVAQPQRAGAETLAQVATVSADPNDWPTYNHDVIGTRHNSGEKMLSRVSVGQVVEKWRFPAADSSEQIGVVHATVVVNGHVYF